MGVHANGEANNDIKIKWRQLPSQSPSLKDTSQFPFPFLSADNVSFPPFIKAAEIGHWQQKEGKRTLRVLNENQI